MLSIPAKLQRGEIVRTTYDTGPYSIIEVDGPCTCPSYHDELNHPNPPPAEPHYHLVCTSPGTKGQFYLNGYRHDGTNVWNDDSLIFPFRSQNSYRPG